MDTPLHITFSQIAGEALKRSFEISDKLKGDIISLSQDLSIGPIKNLHTSTGARARVDWLTGVAANTSDLSYLLESDQSKYEQIKLSLGQRDTYIWSGSDSQSRLALSKLFFEIRNDGGPVFMLDFPPVVHYPEKTSPFVNIGILHPQQIAELSSCFRLTESLAESIHSPTWMEISSNEGLLRVIDDGNVVNVNEDYFDGILLSHCDKSFKTSARVIGETLWDVFSRDQTICHTFLNWRLKELVSFGALYYEGSLKDMRDYMVRLRD